MSGQPSLLKSPVTDCEPVRGGSFRDPCRLGNVSERAVAVVAVEKVPRALESGCFVPETAGQPKRIALVQDHLMFVADVVADEEIE